jgi:hypothetical protein
MSLFQRVLDREHEPLAGALGEQLEKVRGRLFDARRFTVDEAIGGIIEELARTSWQKQNGSRTAELGSAILPGPLTWIELSGASAGERQAIGWLLEATDPDLRSFTGAWLFGVEQGDGYWIVALPIQGAFGSAGPHMAAHAPDVRLERLLPRLEASVTACAVIACLLASPKTMTIEVKGFGERHARARRARGREPMLSWSEVSIRLDQRIEARAAGGEATGHRVALHQVRSFWRIRLGKVEFVRSHLRGSAAVGIRRTDVRVTGQPALVLPPVQA